MAGELASRKETLSRNLMGVQNRLAVLNSQRELTTSEYPPADLLPVTKFHPVSDIEILSSLGVHAVGENREQEAREKFIHCSQGQSSDRTMQFHMIGQLQSKKVNKVIQWATMVQTVDSLKLAQVLNRAVEKAVSEGIRGVDLPLSGQLDVLIQLSADGDPTRGGITADGVDELLHEISEASFLTLRGMMLVPPKGVDPLPIFEWGRAVVDASEHYIQGTPIYSAGMSKDMECAVAAGSTMVRVGTDILGSRPVI